MQDLLPSLPRHAELLAFAQRQIRQRAYHERVDDPRPEQRDEHRRVLAVPAILQPLDAELRACGAPLGAVTRDISPRGLGLILESAPQHERFAVQLEVDGQSFCLLVQTAWHHPMGPFEYVGFRILKQLPRGDDQKAHESPSQAACAAARGSSNSQRRIKSTPN